MYCVCFENTYVLNVYVNVMYTCTCSELKKMRVYQGFVLYVKLCTPPPPPNEIIPTCASDWMYWWHACLSWGGGGGGGEEEEKQIVNSKNWMKLVTPISQYFYVLCPKFLKLIVCFETFDWKYMIMYIAHQCSLCQGALCLEIRVIC